MSVDEDSDAKVTCGCRTRGTLPFIVVAVYRSSSVHEACTVGVRAGKLDRWDRLDTCDARSRTSARPSVAARPIDSRDAFREYLIRGWARGDRHLI